MENVKDRQKPGFAMRVKDALGNLIDMKPGGLFRNSTKSDRVYRLMPDGSHRRVSKKLTGKQRRALIKVARAN